MQHGRPVEGYVRRGLGAIGAFLEPFCGHSSLKKTKSLEIGFGLRFEEHGVAQKLESRTRDLTAASFCERYSVGPSI